MKPLLLLPVLAACVWACACAPVSPTALPGASAVVVDAAPTATPDGALNPLTGLALTVPADHLPIVAKLSNAPALVRPQAGIGAADVVFEHYVEGGLTRFSAVFYGSAPARVGSIRSGRLIDAELVPMFGALLAFGGASDGVMRLYQASDVAARLYSGIVIAPPVYWRDESLPAPHNLFVDTAALWALAARDGQAGTLVLSGWTFSADVPPGHSGTATRVDVRYAATLAQWRYADGVYARSSDGLPHTDATTGAQVTAANVVILYAAHRETDIVESVWQGVTSYSLFIDLNGTGDALLFRDGRVYGCRWVRDARGVPLRLETADGAALALKPGVTWFQVVPLPAQLNAAAEWVRWGD